MNTYKSIKHSLFTAPKRFDGGLLLNLLGFHLARIAVFNLMYRPRKPKTLEEKELAAKGIVVIKNFLPSHDFERLKKECESAPYKIRNERCPKVENAPFSGVVNTFLGVPPDILVERISYASEDIGKDSTDERSDLLHFDVSYPTFKWFLYVYDTTKENGAFTYIPGSNRMTLSRLWMEYLMSIKVSSWSRKRQEQETPAVSNAYLAHHGMIPISMEVPANSLIIVNTQGLHKRGEFTTTKPRLVVAASYRPHQAVSSVIKRTFSRN